jgi:hypothetical protein
MQRMAMWSKFRTSRMRIALVMAVLAVMGIAASSASAYIYVSGPFTNWVYGPHPNPSTIERLTNDGSAVQPNFISPTRAYWGIQVSGDRIYWLDYPVPQGDDCNVDSASLAGTDVKTLATIDDLGRCSGASIALADGYLYWANGGETIGRLSLSPPYSAQPDFIHIPRFLYHPLYGEPFMTSSEAFQVQTDGTWLYWMDEMRHTVGRARVDGTDVEPALFMPQPPGYNVGLLGAAQGYLYWGWNHGDGNVGRARTDGTDIQPNYLTGFHTAGGALTSRWLYFTGQECGSGCVNVSDVVQRVALEPGATPQLVAQGLGEGAGSAIAVDSLGGTFPKVRIKKHRDGTATALVSAPRRAKVSVRGERIVRARATHRRSKVARVAIQPRRATERALRRHGAVHVRTRIRYRPFKGLPRFQSRTVTLRLHARF